MQERIPPLKQFNKTVVVPPDKSISHRGIMLGLLADGETKVDNLLLSDDILATADCVKRLGGDVKIKDNTAVVRGIEKFNSASLYAANSGTTMRLISGILASRNGEFTIDGDSSLNKRPMKRIIEPLSKMGGKIESVNGCSPLRITGSDLTGITYQMPVDSAQVKSAILLAGLNASGETKVIEVNKSRDHTELMLKAMGAKIEVDGLSTTVSKSVLRPVTITVPADISSSAYGIVLAAAKKDGYVKLLNVGINPTRTGILNILSKSGVKFKISNRQNFGFELVADIEVFGSVIAPFNIERHEIPELVDEIPILAVLACFADGTSVISGAEELKVKESNRIETVVNSLKKMGADITETHDGMIINGKKSLAGGAVIDSHNDHRIAMSMAVCAALSLDGALIEKSECASVSYPDFYKMLLG